MLRLAVFACIALSAPIAGSGLYPHSSHTLMNPGTFNLLYSADTGPINETWYFTKKLALTGLIVPSQIIDFNNSVTYDEHIKVRVFRFRISPPNTTEVGKGEFRGSVSYGQEIHIPITYGSDWQSPVMQVTPGNGDNMYKMEFAFQTKGFYPWYTINRKFSTTGVVNSAVDTAGYCIGVSYSLV